MDLDDPSDVAIVTCTDGTTLLRASASKVLLRHLGKREADDDNDDNDSSKQRELKAGADKGRKRKVATSKATSSKATSSKATSSKANTSKATSSEASTSKATRDGAPQNALSAPQVPRVPQLPCNYHRLHLSMLIRIIFSALS